MECPVNNTHHFVMFALDDTIFILYAHLVVDSETYCTSCYHCTTTVCYFDILALQFVCLFF